MDEHSIFTDHDDWEQTRTDAAAALLAGATERELCAVAAFVAAQEPAVCLRAAAFAGIDA